MALLVKNGPFVLPPPNPPNPPKVEPPVDSGSGRCPFGLGGTGLSRGSLGFASSIQ